MEVRNIKSLNLIDGIGIKPRWFYRVWDSKQTSSNVYILV